MLSVADAKSIILSTVQSLAPRTMSLASALDCVLSEDVVSSMSLPPWDNSAVDGYAVRSVDVASASENNPIHLHITERVTAGSVPTTPLQPLTCARIFTGAPIPQGGDAVVMQEDTRPHHEGYIAVLGAVDKEENVRRAGSDIGKGDTALRAGTPLGSSQLAAAAAIGVTDLKVIPRLRVGVVATGAEIVEPGIALKPGQIYDCNSTSLCALVKKAACEPVDLGIADDVREDLAEKIEYGLSECDAVITAGGASVGESDLIKEVLAELGCEVKFWRVAMKPGKPFLFAMRHGKPVFGLPGNPVSAAVTFLVLARPALLKMRGMTDGGLRVEPAKLMEDVSNHGDRTVFLRVKLESIDGRPVIRQLCQQGSHAIFALAQADGLLEVSPQSALRRGQIVPVLILE